MTKNPGFGPVSKMKWLKKDFQRMEAPQPCRLQAFPPLGDDEVKLNSTCKIDLR